VPKLRLDRSREAAFGAERAAVRRADHRRARKRRGLLRRRGLRLPELAGIIPRLEASLAARTPRQVVRPEARRAAVAVILGGNADPAIVLIRRRERTGDPWSGQMAFPGGFQASDREALERTAERETEEETGLRLAAAGRLLGALDDVSPRTPHLPPLIVAPFVFAVPGSPGLTPGEEVDQAIWVPVRELTALTNRTTYTLRLPDASREFPAIRIGPHVVWGLTERILADLFTVAGIEAQTSAGY
jgi:8-oxo-dGTP pyrophosphatase MutT (NUDIX family)